MKCPFFKNVPFFANTDCCPDFLIRTYKLTCMDLPNNNEPMLHNAMKKMLGMDFILREKKGQWWENIECIINCMSSI